MEFILAAWEPNWDVGILGTLSGVLKLAAFVVVVAGLFLIIKAAISGKIGKAALNLVGTIVAGALLWNPAIVTDLIGAVSNAGDPIVETVDGVVQGGNSKSGGGAGAK